MGGWYAAGGESRAVPTSANAPVAAAHSASAYTQSRFGRLPVAEVVRTAVAKGPAFAPGEQQQYLNINYTCSP